MDGMVNWENSSSDGDRFSITEYRKRSHEKRRGLKCFDEYLEKKEKRQKEKDQKKIQKAEQKNLKQQTAKTLSNQLQ